MRLASSSVNEIFFISPAYIFPYIHTYIHTIHTHIHAYTDTYIPTYKHACIHCTSIYSSMSIYGGISGGNVLEEKCPDENVLDPRTHYIGGGSFLLELWRVALLKRSLYKCSQIKKWLHI